MSYNIERIRDKSSNRNFGRTRNVFEKYFCKNSNISLTLCKRTLATNKINVGCQTVTIVFEVSSK